MTGLSFTSKTSCFDCQKMEYRTSEFDLERDHLCQHLVPPLPTSLRSGPLFFSHHSEALVRFSSPHTQQETHFWSLLSGFPLGRICSKGVATSPVHPSLFFLQCPRCWQFKVVKDGSYLVAFEVFEVVWTPSCYKTFHKHKMLLSQY